MSYDIAISLNQVEKIFKIFNKPHHRLIQNFTKKKLYDEKVAINNITLDITKGDVIGILGKNGSGKSTLLQLIVGTLTPTSGLIKKTGRIAALLELGSGFNPEFTGIENIYLNGAVMGLSKENIDSTLEDIITFADIGDYINRPVKTYSSGMYVRLAFACAVNVNPDILIVDEALAVGDMQFQLKCIEKMKEFKKKGVTILYVSHDSYSIRNFCDKAIWLKDGEIYMNGNVDYVTEEYQNYMKSGVEVSQVRSETNTNSDKNLLVIKDVLIKNGESRMTDTIKYKDDFDIEIFYELKEKTLGIIGGVALYDSQGTYVCGLNTKLDRFELPNNSGSYRISIEYKNVNLLPGKYYLDIGFFESSAVVSLDYSHRKYCLTIYSGEYFAEGMVFLDHNWSIKEVNHVKV